MKAELEHSFRFVVWILIGSEALLFAGLFALYTGYRGEYPVAFAHGAAHDVQWIGGVMTMLLVASSFVMTLAVHDVREGRHAAAARWLVLVMLLGAAFATLKIGEWFIHIDEGITATTVTYAGPSFGRGTRLFYTLYYLMTGLHLFHLCIGMGLLAWGYVIARRRSETGVLKLELIGLYWNFVDMIWMFLWPLFYLMRVPS